MQSIDTQFWYDQYLQASGNIRRDIDDAFEAAFLIFKARGYDDSRMYTRGVKELLAAMTHYATCGIPTHSSALDANLEPTPE